MSPVPLRAPQVPWGIEGLEACDPSPVRPSPEQLWIMSSSWLHNFLLAHAMFLYLSIYKDVGSLLIKMIVVFVFKKVTDISLSENLETEKSINKDGAT